MKRLHLQTLIALATTTAALVACDSEDLVSQLPDAAPPDATPVCENNIVYLNREGGTYHGGEDSAIRNMIYHHQTTLEDILPKFNKKIKEKMASHIDKIDKIGDDTLDQLELQTKMLCYNKKYLPIQRKKAMK